MDVRNTLTMISLAAIWGGSFLFLRMAAPVVGPFVVAASRLCGAALLLLPLVVYRGDLSSIRRHRGALLLGGMLSSGLPFIGLSLAAKRLPAGLMSILNATTPMWGALIGWAWHGERLHPARMVGLGVGLAGVVLLASGASASASDGFPLGAWALMLVSTMSYAFFAHYARTYLQSLNPISNTVGTLGLSGLVMLLPALYWGPHGAIHDVQVSHWHEVPHITWLALSALSFVCTGLAYMVFYRLLDQIGPTRALTVTFLIPVFGMLWGALLLGEQVTTRMVASAGVIAAGTWLANRPA